MVLDIHHHNCNNNGENIYELIPKIFLTWKNEKLPPKLHYAIARIVAGLVPTDAGAQINPALGASLVEASMPVFVAAVQLAAQDQRDWVVHKLGEIHRLTGWATAGRIRLGCMRAWEKAAAMGAGPAYVRPRGDEDDEAQAEDQAYYEAQQSGARDEGLFQWQAAGRRTVDAVGILGDRDEV